MQRFAAVWTASPRKLIGALLMLVVASGLAVGSGASFTSQSASPGNMITAGALTVNNDKKANGTEGAIFHADNMKPGDTVTGTVTVSNTGDVPGVFSLGMAAPTTTGPGSDLSDRLKLTVEELNGSNAVTGTPLPATLVSSVAATALGTWAGNTSHTYRFTVTWPTGLTNDNDYQSSGLSLDFTWSATQA